MDPQALELANRTLAAAIDSLMSKGSPVAPLVFVERDGKHEPRRVAAARTEDPAAIAKQMASDQEGADSTAYAVDGFITYNGVRSPGLIVEAWNFRAQRGARIGLRYELKGVMRRKPSLLGSPLHLGRNGWYDPEDEDAPADPPPVAPVVAAPPGPPDFGPPPTSAPVPGYDPPASALPAPAAPAEPPVETPAAGLAPAPPPPEARPVLDTAPPSAAHPVDVPPAPPAAVPDYVPVPIQRNETPLGNRAMFTGIMELATKGRSFPAFAIVQKGGAWEQVTMTDASLEEAAASVRAYARSRTDAEFIAFAVDGTVPVGDIAADAVIVEVWEYATRVSFSVAQRYVRAGDPPSPRLSGRPLMRTQAGWVDVPSSMMLGGQVQFGYRDPDSP